jgi:hypothetical protein
MRKLLILAAIVLISGLFVGSCAKKKAQRIETRPILSEIKVDNRGYLKKTVIVLTNQVQTPAGRAHGQRLMQQLSDTLTKRVDDILLVSEGDPGFPAFTAAWADYTRPVVVQDIARTARQSGFQTLLRANLLAVQTSSRKEGFWLLRKDRYYVTVKTILDVLDPFTAAKMASIVAEKKVKIGDLDHEAYQAGEQTEIEDLDEAIDEMAEDLARQAGELIEAAPWRCAVVGVQGNRLLLAAGAPEGVNVGDRFSVFESRAQVQSKTGAAFLVPGFKLGEVDIVAVNGPTSEAEMASPLNIQADDFAVPTR